MRRFLFAVTLATLAVSVFSADAFAEAAKKGTYPLLPPGPGRDVMIRVCSQCHTPERAAGERHDLKGWNGIIDQMANNGATATDAEFDQIAAYLAKSFPPGKK